MKINPKSIGVFILNLLVLVSVLLAQNPRLLNYQGKLIHHDGANASGTFDITFAIYTEATGTKPPLWKEKYYNLTVTNGIFNVLLGSQEELRDTLFTASGSRYLGITVAGEAEMTPRFQLTSVPYSMHANSANELLSTPIIGRWYATNRDAAAPGSPASYKWGVEVLNTDPNVLARTPDLKEIEVKKTGYYQIGINVLQSGLAPGQRGDVYLSRNGIPIAASLGYGGSYDLFFKHILTITESFKQGDKIAVQCMNHQTYADGVWSTLEIVKLK